MNGINREGCFIRVIENLNEPTTWLFICSPILTHQPSPTRERSVVFLGKK